ncbi:MAG: LysR family transcriptional regulator [Solirubrobacterales bacterium]|nr:LysR family transcriptional regulator [Solirubrobacterales bacterium]
MTEPEWSDFRVLLALGRAGSMAGAARILGVDASTISRRLAAAEKATGAVLIVRGGRDFAFTTEGQVLLRAAEAMDTAVAEAVASVRAARAELAGVVRLSLPPSMVHFLRRFPHIVAERHPGLGVVMESNRAVADLARGEADIAVRASRPTAHDLIIRYVFELGLAIYASRAYLDRAGRPSSTEDLRRHKLVLYNATFTSAPVSWLEEYHDQRAPVSRVDSVDMALSAIAAGEGIGVLYCCHGDSYAELERVLPDPIASQSLHVLYGRAARGSARVKAVADFLIVYLVEHRDALAGAQMGG